ncbi:2-oxoglutarate-dependent dioxygenase 19-like [Cornus florida]|uniref:2-oxoglutarate-dependent dioxygenase 19-like n=1 Tax=Cornus florida TaxID=4283 RepID=UPI002899F380|nr:2-oxoglutarate-dependent dioxygenase 19-like [Cornus florida]
MSSVKELVERGCLTSIPSKFVLAQNSNDLMLLEEEEAEEIPIIDFSHFSGSAKQAAKVIQDIGYACQQWGFFMLINHGMPENLVDEMLKVSQSFFELSEDEKREYTGKSLFDPVRYGTSFNVSVDKTLFWRDHLKVQVHPNFNAPLKPNKFREFSQEYCKRARDIAGELLKGISSSLGLEENYINKEMEVEFGSQLLLINLYPPCPQPEVAMGMPPHSDHGLLTLLVQNEENGLQVLHNHKWVLIKPLANSILVNTGDHMEILTNGKYKSVLHRAMVNNRATRISVGTAHGPPLERIVSPSKALVDTEISPAAYRGIKYREYIELQQSNVLNGKSCLGRIRVDVSL